MVKSKIRTVRYEKGSYDVFNGDLKIGMIEYRGPGKWIGMRNNQDSYERYEGRTRNDIVINMANRKSSL
jgi:hypothetical protein